MRISKTGIAFIKGFEGCRLKAYQDSVGVWTIGYGHTKGVYPGMSVSQDLADKFLSDDLWTFEDEVESLLSVPVTQNQFDALVSFAYNVGSDIDEDSIAEGLGDSTLLKKLNSGDMNGASDEFPKWNKAKGRILAGLSRRRKAERELFLA